MANEVLIRVNVPYEEIKREINISLEELEKKYGSIIQKELANLLSYAPDTDLIIERYYQVCVILSNIKVYNWKIAQKINPKEEHQINMMALMGDEFEKLLKEVNSYFLRSTGALDRKDFDIEKDFVKYYNNQCHNDWGN